MYKISFVSRKKLETEEEKKINYNEYHRRYQTEIRKYKLKEKENIGLLNKVFPSMLKNCDLF